MQSKGKVKLILILTLIFVAIFALAACSISNEKEAVTTAATKAQKTTAKPKAKQTDPITETDTGTEAEPEATDPHIDPGWETFFEWPTQEQIRKIDVTYPELPTDKPVETTPDIEEYDAEKLAVAYYELLAGEKATVNGNSFSGVLILGNRKYNVYCYPGYFVVCGSAGSMAEAEDADSKYIRCFGGMSSIAPEWKQCDDADLHMAGLNGIFQYPERYLTSLADVFSHDNEMHVISVVRTNGGVGEPKYVDIVSVGCSYGRIELTCDSDKKSILHLSINEAETILDISYANEPEIKQAAKTTVGKTVVVTDAAEIDVEDFIEIVDRACMKLFGTSEVPTIQIGDDTATAEEPTETEEPTEEDTEEVTESATEATPSRPTVPPVYVIPCIGYRDNPMRGMTIDLLNGISPALNYTLAAPNMAYTIGVEVPDITVLLAVLDPVQFGHSLLIETNGISEADLSSASIVLLNPKTMTPLAMYPASTSFITNDDGTSVCRLCINLDNKPSNSVILALQITKAAESTVSFTVGNIIMAQESGQTDRVNPNSAAGFAEYTYYYGLDYHTYLDKWETVKQATEKESGLEVGYVICSVQDVDGSMLYDGTYLVERIVEPIAHHHVEQVIPGVPATCTEKGKTASIVCSECGEILQKAETIPAKGHTVEIIPGKPATCKATGMSDGEKCSVCGEILKKQETVPKANHTPQLVKGTPATCTKSGTKDGEKCSVCGVWVTKQTTIPALGHDYKQVAAKAPTCTENGSTAGSRCSRCNAWEYEPVVIPAMGHTEVQISGTEPTCTNSGLSDGVKCAVCGKWIKPQQTLPAAGHKWSESLAVDSIPSYTHQWTGRHTCIICGAKSSPVLMDPLEKTADWEIVLEKTTYQYTGQPIEPVITVMYNGQEINPLFYIVTYENNVEAGTATLTVTSRDGDIPIVGSKSATFRIR